jgi:hypothetical protein
LKLLDGKTFCATCAARPDVNYLETFRLKFWGKRDGWAWLIGFGGLVGLINVAQSLSAGQYAAAIGGLVGSAVNVSFFFGLRWARYGFLATIVLAALITIAAAPENSRGVVVGTFVVPLVIALAVFNDTRNQLFFKVEIPRARLQKAWDLYMNNTVARAGFMMSLIGVIMPPFAVLGLVASIIGLRNVDPNAMPPIGRKGQALAGIVFSSLTMLGWGAVLINYLVTKGQ